MVHLKATPGDNEDYRLALEKLSEESKRLQRLRELHALKLANRCRRKELEDLKAQLEQTQGKLMELMRKVENFTGEIIARRCKSNLPS